MQDIEYLKSLYPREVRILQGYVSEACDRMDYRNSPMYDEYPDQLMIDRICGTICETVEAAEWGERGKKTWDQSGEDREKLAFSIDLDMKGNIVPESENGTEDKRQEDYGSTEEREPEYTSGDDYRESLVNPSGIQMEIQEMMAGEKGEESNPSQWSFAEMLFQNGADSELQQRPGSMSRLRDTEGFSAMEDRGSIYSPGPRVRPPRPPYAPQPGPGPVRPPRPPYGPQPGPGPVRPPRPPYTPQPGPGQCVRLVHRIHLSRIPGRYVRLVHRINLSQAPGRYVRLTHRIHPSQAPGQYVRPVHRIHLSRAPGQCVRPVHRIHLSRIPGRYVRLTPYSLRDLSHLGLEI